MDNLIKAWNNLFNSEASTRFGKVYLFIFCWFAFTMWFLGQSAYNAKHNVTFY